MINKLFENEYAAFLIVSTVITTTMLLLKLRFKFLTLLWKSTLISYIIFLILVSFMCISEYWQMKSEHAPTHLFGTIYLILGPLLLTPGILIQALIFGGGPCLSGNHVLFNIFTFAFLFYTVVIWGIMEFIKCCKDSLAPEQKQDGNMEKQTPTETNLKDQ
jgi:hypothetical protein